MGGGLKATLFITHLPISGHEEAPPYLARLLEVPSPYYSLGSFFKSRLPEAPL